LKFVERTNETAYVSIKSNADDGCWSELGFSGQKQELNLGSGCVYVVNELFANLNFAFIIFHNLEHSNPRADALIGV
jgi:Astacin (Peptidase family M12A)